MRGLGFLSWPIRINSHGVRRMLPSEGDQCVRRNQGDNQGHIQSKVGGESVLREYACMDGRNSRLVWRDYFLVIRTRSLLPRLTIEMVPHPHFDGSFRSSFIRPSYLETRRAAGGGDT